MPFVIVGDVVSGDVVAVVVVAVVGVLARFAGVFACSGVVGAVVVVIMLLLSLLLLLLSLLGETDEAAKEGVFGDFFLGSHSELRLPGSL